MERLYAGIDLHATSLQLCVVGEDLEPRLERTLLNAAALVLAAASPDSGYARLSQMPGFGRALSAVVFYETGDAGRFPSARHYPRMKEFYDRQASRHPGRGSKLIATCVLGHRLASAAYHILKEGTHYRDELLFSA